ncbi:MULTISPECIES: NADH dehydrogenase ubiquinone Fe-S protein 4 [Sphingomonadaceae]|nr:MULTISPECIES: NADH dehydrogenase ubiquinone Fe-S protein 4 [Sphingomonadaceae]
MAIIEPMPIATNQGGRARRGQWRVRFEPRCPPFIDPLTGWTGGRDPLAHVELRFQDRGAAERYCRSTGLIFRLGAYPGLLGGGRV